MTNLHGIGTDLADIAPFRGRPFQDRPSFYRLVFTEAERDYCLARPDPAPHWAARFAAKEAAVKALAGQARVAIPQIEVIRSPEGVPSLRLVSRRGEDLPDLAGLRLRVSLSHGTDFALAFVVAVTDQLM